nr:MAG TPA: hypothetical protein [Caudoviricetes sp.]
MSSSVLIDMGDVNEHVAGKPSNDHRSTLP